MCVLSISFATKRKWLQIKWIELCICGDAGIRLCINAFTQCHQNHQNSNENRHNIDVAQLDRRLRIFHNLCFVHSNHCTATQKKIKIKSKSKSLFSFVRFHSVCSRLSLRQFKFAQVRYASTRLHIYEIPLTPYTRTTYTNTRTPVHRIVWRIHLMPTYEMNRNGNWNWQSGRDCVAATQTQFDNSFAVFSISAVLINFIYRPFGPFEYILVELSCRVVYCIISFIYCS